MPTLPTMLSAACGPRCSHALASWAPLGIFQCAWVAQSAYTVPWDPLATFARPWAAHINCPGPWAPQDTLQCAWAPQSTCALWWAALGTLHSPQHRLDCMQAWRSLTLPCSFTSRLAFGMVSHTNEKQTSYCLEIVMRHCREIFEVHKFHNLDI